MKKLITIVICVLLLSTIAMSAFAADTTEFKIETNQTDLKPGDTVTFTVSVTGKEIAKSMGIVLNYDTNVFELVGGAFTMTQGMGDFFSFNNGFAILFGTPQAYNGQIGTFTLKVKADTTTFGSTTVTGTPSVKNGSVTIASSVVGDSVNVNCQHSYGDWINADENNHKHTCPSCGDVQLEAHKWDAGKITKNPTCKDEGVKTYTCTVCGGTKTETAAKTNDHTYGDWTKADDNNHKHTCTLCGNEETAAHNWDAGKTTKEPTCNAAGEKTYTCADCKATKTETVAATGKHTYGEWVKVDETTHKHTCTGCGVASETANHNWNAGEITTQPTCNADGVKTFTCTDCKATKTEVVKSTGAHTYGEWIKVDENTHKHTCTGCGVASETANHKWNAGEITTQPTCKDTGVKTYTCTDCKATKTETVGATGVHTYGEWVKVDENTHKHTCTGCGEATETANHNWDAGKITKDPTCKDEGVKTYTCTDCKATKTEVVEKSTEHKYGKWTDVDDNTHKHVCSVCEKEETADHTWNNGTVTKPATCKEEGVRTYTCTGCGKTRTETLEKLTTHTYDHDCDTDCNVCGLTRTTEHKYKENWSADWQNHYHACSVCGDKKDVEKHTPGAAATETTAQKCTVCDYVLVAALGHQHKWEDKLSSDENSHWYACGGCNEKKDEAEHGFENDCDTDCPDCDYTRTTEHKFSDTWTSDENSHWHECSVCGEKADEEAHAPGVEATEDTAQTCTACEYELVPALGHTHAFTEGWHSDAANHWHECDCGEKSDEAAHTWNEGEENEDGTMKYTCTECLEEKTEGEPRGSFPWWIIVVIAVAVVGVGAVVIGKKKKA